MAACRHWSRRHQKNLRQPAAVLRREIGRVPGCKLYPSSRWAADSFHPDRPQAESSVTLFPGNFRAKLLSTINHKKGFNDAKTRTLKKQFGNLCHRAGLHGHEFFLRSARGQSGDDHPETPVVVVDSCTGRYLFGNLTREISVAAAASTMLVPAQVAMSDHAIYLKKHFTIRIMFR